MPKTIDDYRKTIDELDEKIVGLLNLRLTAAREIGKIKADQNEPVLDNSRETKLMQRLDSLNTGPLTANSLKCIYADIITASREIQKPQRVAFLGPEATHTHIASMTHFGRSAKFVDQSGIENIFREVEKGACEFGVVPVENSIEGTVNHTLDLFVETELTIGAEIYKNISHDLLFSKDVDIRSGEIKTIYSHPHAFAQCRNWLRDNLPDVTTIDCPSTALAARKASQEQGTAAIASPEAARTYDLQIVAAKIEDQPRNMTRFLVIGKEKPAATGHDRTSLLFVTAHMPGALHKVLQPLAELGINMVKLESRPSRRENWNYCFFVDLEGHIKDEKIQGAVEKMKKHCMFLKCFGSYPRSSGEC